MFSLRNKLSKFNLSYLNIQELRLLSTSRSCYEANPITDIKKKKIPPGPGLKDFLIGSHLIDNSLAFDEIPYLKTSAHYGLNRKGILFIVNYIK